VINVNKLKGRIVEKGFNVDGLTEKIGMDRSTFYRKLNQKGETFSIKEANLICKELDLTPAEAMAIFFSDLVA